MEKVIWPSKECDEKLAQGWVIRGWVRSEGKEYAVIMRETKWKTY